MQVELVKEYRFEAAHRLPRLPDGHKCKRLHGHSFRFEVRLAGEVDRQTGFLVDFWDVDAAVAPLLERLDHHYLNEVEGLENPTSEVLAGWIYQQLRPRLPQLEAVTVSETCDSRVIYRGERT
jgi:6-pyruvoyltetrahydropterin/6-carboxytetrahydropterin synthase